MFCRPDMNQNIQQNRSTRFLKAIGLYAIGNLGSRLLTFLMVPLYTYFIAPDQMGFYDVSLTLIIALIPIFTLQMRDGAYRFLINETDNDNKKRIVSVVMKELLISTLLIGAIWLGVGLLYPIKCLTEICLLLLVMIYCEVLLQVARAVGGTASFAIAGIISSFGIGIFSIMFVVWLGCGLEGVFWANILARVVVLCFIEYKVKLLRNFFSLTIDTTSIQRPILKYILPLLPTALGWCLLDCSGRLFVQHYLGLEVSGMFAVSFRFASIIYTFAIIFIQAWQEMALLNYESKDRDSFFSEMYNTFIYYIALVVLVVSFMLKFNYGWLVEDGYGESLKLLYPMSVAIAICTMSQFLDLGYQCSKETQRSIPSIFVAFAVNLLVSFLLIEKIGVWAVVSASILGFMALFVYRSIDVRRYFILKVNIRSMLAVTMCIISVVPFYMFDYMWSVVYFSAVMVVMIMLMPDALKNKLNIKRL